jgi:hypothetical protein
LSPNSFGNSSIHAGSRNKHVRLYPKTEIPRADLEVLDGKQHVPFSIYSFDHGFGRPGVVGGGTALKRLSDTWWNRLIPEYRAKMLSTSALLSTLLG